MDGPRLLQWFKNVLKPGSHCVFTPLSLGFLSLYSTPKGHRWLLQ